MDKLVKLDKLLSSLQELQEFLPWIERLWSENYRNDPRPYKDIEHSLINIVQLTSSLLLKVERTDHHGEDYPDGIMSPTSDPDIARTLAWIVTTCLRIAKKRDLDITVPMRRDLIRRGDEWIDNSSS